MKKSGFAKGVIWTLSIGILLVFVLAAIGMIAYSGYNKAALEATYSKGNTETTIKIEKKDKLSSEIISTDNKQVKLNQDFLKDKTKLNFKEYGPFFGIKKGNQWIRGVHVGPKNESAQSTWYGTFAKDNMYHKGYWVHTYSDGKVIYQYSEFKLDKQGKVIKDDKGIFLVEDSYVITKDDFEKVKSYIQYDIELPFSFYNFDVNDKAETTNETKLLVSKNDYKDLENIKKNLEIDGSPFTMSLENLDTGEKNISVSIKKSKSLMKGLSDSVVWTTKFTYLSKEEKTQDGTIDGGLSRSYSITEYEKFPNYKVERAKRELGQISKYINLPKETELYKITKSNSLIINDISYLSNESIRFGEDNGYLSWSDLALRGNNIKERTIVEGIGTKQGKLKKIIGGLCKNPNDLFKAMYKKYVNNCDMAFLDAFNDTKRMVNVHFDNILNKNLQKKLLANLDNQKTIISNDEKYYALIIGNNNYQYLEKLDAAENDAIVIADVLEKKYGFDVDLLLNADYDQTVNSLFKITDKLKRNDNLLIYYAGHGELDKDENRGYWLPVDASYEMRSKWISNQRIVDRIKATKAKHVLLVADSCFSGTLMRSGDNLEKEQSIDEKYIKRLKNKKTRLVITSGGNEPVVDSVGGDHSLFALKFIDTLKNNNTVINSQILFENVRRYVVANADQTPERAMVHKTGHDGGDFLFFPK